MENFFIWFESVSTWLESELKFKTRVDSSKKQKDFFPSFRLGQTCSESQKVKSSQSHDFDFF